MLIGREVVFNMTNNRLYYHKTVDCAIVIVNMVADHRKGFTRQEYKGAKAAHHALGLVGSPFEQEFTNTEISNMIVN